MKFIKNILFVFILLCFIGLISSAPFNSTWTTSNIGESNSSQIKLPLTSNGAYDFTINWGDGIIEQITFWNQAEKTHTYPGVGGTYNVSINGTIVGWSFNNLGDKRKIIDISNWGDLQLGNNGRYFYGAENLDVTATDIPNLSGTTNFYTFFMNCKSLKLNPSINNWDVSNVVNMNRAFTGASSFNQPLNNWDVSSVTDMDYMFRDSKSFNQNINNWNTSNVLKMNNMFSVANSFNGNVSNWDVSSVKGMEGLFSYAYAFDQDISNWDVSSVTDMDYMFLNAYDFNKDISNWDVSSVTSMRGMFWNAAPSRFDQNLGSWDVSSVGNFQNMLDGIKLSPTNYDSLLIGWASLNLKPNMEFNAKDSRYTPSASDERQHIIDTYNWTIIDGGLYSLPDVTSMVFAITEPDGSVTIRWNSIGAVTNHITEEIDYKIFRTTDFSSLDTYADSPLTIIEDKLHYYDFNITTGTNYTYVITTLEKDIFYNGDIQNNFISIVPAECTTNYTYTEWSDCYVDTQFRTGTRICYGGGLTEINESQPCVPEGNSPDTVYSSSSSLSTSSDDVKTNPQKEFRIETKILLPKNPVKYVEITVKDFDKKDLS